MLPSTDGSLGSDRLLYISTDLEVSVLSSIDGSLGSDRLPNISTDSEVSVLVSTDGSRGSVFFLRILEFYGNFLEFPWNFLGIFVKISWKSLEFLVIWNR